MAAKPKPKTQTKARTGQEKKKKVYPPIPPALVGLLNKAQVGVALGLVSFRNIDEMISTGEFPRADKRIGRRPRWSVTLVNKRVHDLPSDD